MIAEPTPSSDSPDGVGADHENPLAAMIDQLQENWYQGDDVASDGLMVQIRQYIRSQRLSIEPGRRRR